MQNVAVIDRLMAQSYEDLTCSEVATLHKTANGFEAQTILIQKRHTGHAIHSRLCSYFPTTLVSRVWDKSNAACAMRFAGLQGRHDACASKDSRCQMQLLQAFSFEPVWVTNAWPE